MRVTETAVVFDFGAVLFRWHPSELLRGCVPELAVDEASAAALARSMFESFTPASDWARFDLGLIAEDELADRIAQRLAIDRAQVRRVIDAIPPHMQVQQPTLALFRRLQAAGHRMFFLSNMPKPYADHLERQHGFVREFDDGIFSARVGLMKPTAEMFALAESRFALDPARTVFIDDHAGNVDAARLRGWQALRFSDAADCAADLRQGGWLDD